MGRGRSLRYPTAGTKRPLNSQRVLLPELFQQTSTDFIIQIKRERETVTKKNHYYELNLYIKRIYRK